MMRFDFSDDAAFVGQKAESWPQNVDFYRFLVFAKQSIKRLAIELESAESAADYGQILAGIRGLADQLEVVTRGDAELSREASYWKDLPFSQVNEEIRTLKYGLSPLEAALELNQPVPPVEFPQDQNELNKKLQVDYPWPPEAGDGPFRLLVRCVPDGSLNRKIVILRFQQTPFIRLTSYVASGLDWSKFFEFEVDPFVLRKGNFPVGDIKFELVTFSELIAWPFTDRTRLLDGGIFWALDDGALKQWPAEWSDTQPDYPQMFPFGGDGTERVIMLRTDKDGVDKPLIYLINNEELELLATDGFTPPDNYRVATLADFSQFPPKLMDGILNSGQHWLKMKRDGKFARLDRESWVRDLFAELSFGKTKMGVRTIEEVSPAKRMVLL